jgi:hypothetical protein
MHSPNHCAADTAVDCPSLIARTTGSLGVRRRNKWIASDASRDQLEVVISTQSGRSRLGMIERSAAIAAIRYGRPYSTRDNAAVIGLRHIQLNQFPTEVILGTDALLSHPRVQQRRPLFAFVQPNQHHASESFCIK